MKVDFTVSGLFMCSVRLQKAVPMHPETSCRVG